MGAARAATPGEVAAIDAGEFIGRILAPAENEAMDNIWRKVTGNEVKVSSGTSVLDELNPAG